MRRASVRFYYGFWGDIPDAWKTSFLPKDAWISQGVLKIHHFLKSIFLHHHVCQYSSSIQKTKIWNTSNCFTPTRVDDRWSFQRSYPLMRALGTIFEEATYFRHCISYNEKLLPLPCAQYSLWWTSLFQFGQLYHGCWHCTYCRPPSDRFSFPHHHQYCWRYVLSNILCILHY